MRCYGTRNCLIFILALLGKNWKSGWSKCSLVTSSMSKLPPSSFLSISSVCFSILPSFLRSASVSFFLLSSLHSISFSFFLFSAHLLSLFLLRFFLSFSFPFSPFRFVRIFPSVFIPSCSLFICRPLPFL